MFPSVLALTALFPIFGLIVGMFWLEARLFPPRQNSDAAPDADSASPAASDPAPRRSQDPREHTTPRAHPGASLRARRARSVSIRRPRLPHARRAPKRAAPSA